MSLDTFIRSFIGSCLFESWVCLNLVLGIGTAS